MKSDAKNKNQLNSFEGITESANQTTQNEQQKQVEKSMNAHRDLLEVLNESVLNNLPLYSKKKTISRG